MEALASLFPFAIIILVFWFVLIRPQRKRAQEMQSLQSSLSVGSEVMLASGFFGRVTRLDEHEPDVAWIEIAPATEVKVARQAVVRVLDGAEDPGAAGNGLAPGPDA